ncbi:lysoplasmalogenase [Kordia sp.]|uniref:lysoplasmalogenase n=1 Tax=Kordia sp. TaxID=1965332 RepID=UPI0025BC6AE5|nr:lysoplasmalogenase [Kordia sp.]MCH2196368.1 lysoplasmalogenase [Kordia sp.]
MKTQLFLIIFIIITILELFFGSFEEYIYLHYFTKPAIVVSLLVFFVSNSKHLPTFIKRFTILALFFSLLGDVLLMFVANAETFFIAGLVSFLIAHIMYILVFLRNRNTKMNSTPFILLLLLYATGLFWLIKDGLGDLLIPVLVYMSVILTMATTAFSQKGMILHAGYVYVFVGAIFFMLSDSLLAINKFHNELPLSNVSIMATYALAQILIVLGILKSYKK